MAYMKMKDAVKAEKTYERILEIDPRDGDALSGLKNASAAHASKSGGWETATDYRGVLKDVHGAVKLEQDAKVVKSADAIEEQIQVNFQKHQAEPNNPLYSKAIAQLFLQKNDFGNAVDWFESAYVAGNKIDSSLEKTIGDLRLRKAEQELQELRASLAGLTDPEQQAQQQAAIEQKETELNRVRLSLAEARVRAQPNEGEYRYDLGYALYKVGEYKRATEELQQSLKQPSVRYQALNLMGLCFMKRGMLDFAVKQLALAESELPGMDELKKEIVYNLGLAYEASKQADKSLEQWKKIYEVDMSYRDVATRVEASYS
jgi:tetratricopeptide (TPR) repeat protein